MTYKNTNKKLKWILLRQTEMRAHYEILFKSSIWELKFTRLQKEHLEKLLDEVEVLVEKWVKPKLIKSVIKNWKQRMMIDTSIHFDLVCWIQGFKD
jgi:ferredoxin-fold anticodon binding domain-containing protein